MATSVAKQESRNGLLMLTGAFALVLVVGVGALVYRVRSIVAERTPAVAPAVASLAAGTLKIGDTFPNIVLEKPEGGTWDLATARTPGKFSVVTFHHPDCPCAESCGKLIAEMGQEGYDDVEVFGILASDYDNPRVLAALDQQKAEGIVNFPVLYDKGGVVQKQLGATRTPEMWVLDKDGHVAYYGAPENTLFPGTAGHRYLLREAIDALRAGRTPEIQTHPSIGCPIE